jgi:ankyrin repeat protein
MLVFRQILLATVFVSAFLFLSVITANAQQLPYEYVFLEVVDSENKPISDAETGNQKTDEKGLVKLSSGRGGRDHQFVLNNFIITKPGYFNFEGLGFLTSYRIELFKIPQNDDERKVLGNEQSKREFFFAIKNRDTATLRKLLKSGISPNILAEDLRGISAPKTLSAIAYAADVVSIEALQLLLSVGVKINVKNSPSNGILINYLNADPYFGVYPKTDEEKSKLMARYMEGFDLLIRSGADIEVIDEYLNTPLTVAMDKKYGNILKKILALKYSNKAKSQALYSLIYKKDEKDPRALEYIDLLLKSGANPNFFVDDKFDSDNISDTDCSTLLMTAGNKEKLTFVELLLANKADVNFACKNGKTALHSALEERNTQTAKMLLKNGARVNGKGKDKKTALMLAVQYNLIEIAKMLIDKGANLNARDYANETPLGLAITHNVDSSMIKLLLEAGIDPNEDCGDPLSSAAFYGNLRILKLLVAFKANVNLSCEDGETAIVSAAAQNQVEAVNFLLKAGADVKGKSGKSALKFVTENLQNNNDKAKAEEIIRILQSAGAQK